MKLATLSTFFPTFMSLFAGRTKAMPSKTNDYYSVGNVDNRFNLGVDHDGLIVKLIQTSCEEVQPIKVVSRESVCCPNISQVTYKPIAQVNYRLF